MLLYDAKFLPITIAWAPFPKFFTLFRQNWNVRTSIIDSFSTIYLLSNVKVLSVSMSFPATVYKLISDSVAYGLYCLPSLHYFGRNHAYSVCNISSNCVNSVPTVVLILYPLRFFQRFSTYTSINWHFIHVLLIPSKGATRMELSMELLTVIGFQS